MAHPPPYPHSSPPERNRALSLAKKMALSIVAAIILLAVVVFLAGARETFEAAWQAGPLAFLATGVLLFLMMFFQAAAWRSLERRRGSNIPYRTLLAATIVATAGNILTPASHLGGEPAKIIYAGRRSGISYTRLAGSVLLCKYVEAMSFVVFLGFGTLLALLGFHGVLFSPPNLPLGIAIATLSAAALGVGVLIWIALARRWTPLTSLVGLAVRLRIKRAFFERMKGRALRMELQASAMFREEGGALVPAFLWYFAAHTALFCRPLTFFYLGWWLRLDPAELGLIFLTSQILIAVQLVPSGAGTLDGGLLAVVAIAGVGISVPQCTAFLLCLRFWDAAAILVGAALATRMGIGLVRQRGKDEDT
jgi:uncharacterized protein (TIRG00374 family)